MTEKIVDQHARDKILEELNKNFLVEAGAGSGKTTSLVDRMVNLIYTGTCKINEIVAITFTRKAADELKTRFQNELERKWNMEKSVNNQRRLEEAIQNMEQCFLGTVHAFCARLLRERPVEAGIDVTFKEIEDDEDNLVAEEAWHHYLLNLQEDNPTILQGVRQTGVKENTLLDRFQLLKQYPDVSWVSEPINKPELHHTYEALITLLKEAKRCIPEEIPKGPDGLQKAILEALRMDQFRKKNDSLRIEVFELFDKKSAFNITQYKWTTKEDSKEYKAQFEKFYQDRIEPVLLEWREYCHPIIVQFLKGALFEYEKIKRKRSLLNFQDLLISATNLLKNNNEVRSYFQNKYRCLLVDEFQDTDPIQAEMMFYLTGEDVNELEWTNCKPRPGSLFVVGDPKQGIYRFRRADIDIYNMVKALMVEHGGEVLQLTMNFRTVDSITTRLNIIFNQYLPEKETTYQAAYRPLHSFHKDSNLKRIPIKRLVVPSDFTKNQDMIIKKDAENITLYIQTLLKIGYKPKDFMVITRYNDGIDEYGRTLEDAGIPISVSGETIIGETREFQELFHLLNVFVDTTDNVATVAVLRSVWFGISDEALFQWKKNNGGFSIYSSTPEAFTKGTCHPVEEAFLKLRKYRKWVSSYSPVVAIEKIVEDVGFYPLLVARGYGKREYIQFLQLMEALRKEENRGNTSYEQAVRFLLSRIQLKTKVVNIEEDANAVRILNVHKAKGLEAPVVILAHPGKKPDISDKISTHIKRVEGVSKGYFRFTKQVGRTAKTIGQPREWETYRSEEEAYLLQEEIRIIYVAATRAEKGLVISACEGKRNKNPWDLLDAGIDDIEDILLNQEMVVTEQAKNKETLMGETYGVETANLDNWLGKSTEPSYFKTNPSDEKEELYTLGIERDEGGGLAWGLVIHEVFEALINGRGDLTDEFLKKSLQKNNVSIERLEEVRGVMNQFMDSSLWDELQNGDVTLVEVPFSIQITEEEDPAIYKMLQSREQSSVPIQLTGIIDLVFKINGMWRIVDFKTDRPKDRSLLSDLTEYYTTQITLYTKVWERLTGEAVSSAQLYYVTPNELVTVS
ncbi:UvrD-helicase domain-containing protein [Evansella sp. AB-P1]|uniref:UvrD-helicase domain-containing protein n=1 Tax=Evansella sp. AB-P1 TaxID=3037653 RepID=UPI00241BF372|nr:UvrD-helicase domain-containing protein [Evansella sp. AB-P1]MDG5787194.1 UvrD-helicase domain-containing protein [Evansella sp. AB-P1]